MGTATLSRIKRRESSRDYGDYGYARADLNATPQTGIERTNLLWLCTEMEKLSEDVIDREICRRLRQFAGQVEFDLPYEVVQQIRARNGEVVVEIIPEPLVPFYRHYSFMRRRAERSR